MTHSSLSVANAFLDRASNEGRSLTNMQLHKLMYFAQGWSYASRHQALMAEAPEAWQYGPVYRAVWKEFRDQGSRPIDRPATGKGLPLYWFVKEGEPVPRIEPPHGTEVNAFLDQFWALFKDVPVRRLSDLSHVEGGPWDAVRSENPGIMNAVIPNHLIETYFLTVVREMAAARQGEN